MVFICVHPCPSVATVILTVVLAGAYTVVNRATRINQAAIERSEVTSQLREQAELLRAMRSAHDGTAGSTWSQILAFAGSSTVSRPLDCSNPTGNNAFYLSTETGTFGQPTLFNRSASAELGEGSDAYPDDLFDVWIVSEPSPNDGASTLDDQEEFHIRGCWQGIGGSGTQRAEVIFRLRE